MRVDVKRESVLVRVGKLGVEMREELPWEVGTYAVVTSTEKEKRGGCPPLVNRYRFASSASWSSFTFS